MKKYIKYSLCLVVFTVFYNCNSDDDSQEIITQPIASPSISIKLNADYSVKKYNVVAINPEVTIENSTEAIPVYKWTTKVTAKDGVVKDSIIGDLKSLSFIAPIASEYVINFTVTIDKIVKEASTKVIVSETGLSYNSKALSIIDYLPAPCYNMDDFQFETKAEVLEQIKLNQEDDESYGIPLGTFGGSIIVGFDHTVINAFGKRDFTILMDSENNSKRSPVSVYVAYDANKNGIADDNEWYEIAGSEYNKSTTIKNYEVTYFMPNPNKEAVKGKLDWQFDVEYIKWTDNKNASGTITRTENLQYNNYYPLWMGDSYKVKGTKISLPVKDVSDGLGLNFNIGTFEWGYGGIKDSSIDISWAVDSNGKKVHLPGIDFVKVYVPTFIETGVSNLLINYFTNAEDLNFPLHK